MMAVGCIGYMAQFLGFGMTAGGYYHSQVVLFTFTNVVVAAGCYLLIGRLGIRGAILSMLIAAIVQLVGSIVILVGGVRKHARVRLGNVEAVPPDLLVQA
jgi:hypothetical protein